MLGVMFFYWLFGVGGDFAMEIEIAQIKLNKFRIISIFVSRIGGIISIVFIVIGGISIGGISVGGHVFLVLGVILQY